MRDPLTPSQIELFPGVAANPAVQKNSRLFARSLTVPVENLFVLTVVVIMSLVTAFSIGVESGKRLIVKEKDLRRSVFQRPGNLPDQKTAGKAGSAGSVDMPKEQRIPTAGRAPEKAREAMEDDPGQDIRFDEQPVLAVVPTGEKAFTVQVASYKKEKYAQQEAMGLKDKGYKGHEIFVLPKGNYSILCVGKFDQHDQAKVFSEKLRKKYKDCLVRRL